MKKYQPKAHGEVGEWLIRPRRMLNLRQDGFGKFLK